MPPATATSMSPTRIPWSASITAFKPDPQTLLMVSAATCSGSPPRRAAWRAGFWPSPAGTTLPMMHSSTMSASMPARRTASATTSAPSCGAVKVLSAPRNLPVGVRTALTMTDSRTANLDALDTVGAKKILQPSQDDRRRSHDFARPLRAGGFDDQNALLQCDLRGALHCGTHRRAPGKADFAFRERRVAEQRQQRCGNNVGEGFHAR